MYCTQCLDDAIEKRYFSELDRFIIYYENNYQKLNNIHKRVAAFRNYDKRYHSQRKNRRTNIMTMRFHEQDSSSMGSIISYKCPRNKKTYINSDNCE